MGAAVLDELAAALRVPEEDVDALFREVEALRDAEWRAFDVATRRRGGGEAVPGEGEREIDLRL